MARIDFLIDDEISEIKKLLRISNLEILVRSDWGSENPNHREAIHGELKKRMAKAYPFSDSSISHCPSLGGFAFTEYDSDHVLQLGFDIEEDSRVTAAIAQRICRSEAEFDLAPSPASLWVAKEAAFKALKGVKQPAVVSQIELLNWSTVSSQFETVSVKDPKSFGFSEIKGVLLKKSSFTFAFFTSQP